jgi:hypothetical protein
VLLTAKIVEVFFDSCGDGGGGDFGVGCDPLGLLVFCSLSKAFFYLRPNYFQKSYSNALFLPHEQSPKPTNKLRSLVGG